MVERVFDATKSGMRGVLGTDSTLGALVEEKVRTLVIADGLAIDGSVCTRCDYFSAQEFESCPLCGATAELGDVTDRAVEKAILTERMRKLCPPTRRAIVCLRRAVWARC